MLDRIRHRAAAFCDRFGLRVPILEAPMAGACPASLAVAVANAGGMGTEAGEDCDAGNAMAGRCNSPSRASASCNCGTGGGLGPVEIWLS